MINLLEVSNSTLCDGVLIPNQLFNLVATIVKLIKIAVPVLLIIFGMIDFAKSVVAKNEDDVKKFRKQFISRVVSAIIVFLIVSLTGFVISLVGGLGGEGNSASSAWHCARSVLTGK